MNNSMEFNLELALKGYPIRTRFGHPVVLNKVEFCVTQKKFTDSISITEKSKYIEDSNEILIKKFNAHLHITLDEWKKLNINLIRVIEIIEENGETTIHKYF